MKRFGGKTFTQLRAIGHKAVAYKNAWESRPPLSNSARMKFEDFFEVNTEGAAAAKEEMMENFYLRQAFAKS